MPLCLVSGNEHHEKFLFAQCLEMTLGKMSICQVWKSHQTKRLSFDVCRSRTLDKINGHYVLLSVVGVLPSVGLCQVSDTRQTASLPSVWLQENLYFVKCFLVQHQANNLFAQCTWIFTQQRSQHQTKKPLQK